VFLDILFEHVVMFYPNFRIRLSKIFFFWFHIGMSLGVRQQTPSYQATRQSGGFVLEVAMLNGGH